MLAYAKSTLLMAGKTPEAESIFAFVNSFFGARPLAFSVFCRFLFLMI